MLLSLSMKRSSGPVNGYASSCHASRYAELVAKPDEFLHPKELSYFSTLKHEKRKLSYITGRYAAKRAISAYMGGVPMCEVEVTKGYFDQPSVKHGSHEVPRVTLSHCDSFAVAIACEVEHIMGIDVEDLSPDREKVFERHMTEAEMALAREAQLDYLTLCGMIWAMKEALSKALRCGLMTPFHILEVDRWQWLDNQVLLSRFVNFGQYKAVAFAGEGVALSVVYPKFTRVEVEPLRGLLERGASPAR